MAAEAPVYRSFRLHNLDPTAAAAEGSTRHFYTLVGAGMGRARRGCCRAAHL